MDRISNYMEQLAERSGVRAGIYASAMDLEPMEELGLPRVLLDFYEEHNPSDRIELGDVVLLPLSDMEMHNTEAVPGMYLPRVGFIVFASTTYGDEYCFDVGGGPGQLKDIARIPIKLFSHEECDDSWETMSRSQIGRYGVEVARNLEDFLARMLKGTLKTST